MNKEYKNGLYEGKGDNPYYKLVGVVDKSVKSFIIHKDTREIEYAALHDYNSLTSMIMDYI